MGNYAPRPIAEKPSASPAPASKKTSGKKLFFALAGIGLASGLLLCGAKMRGGKVKSDDAPAIDTPDDTEEQPKAGTAREKSEAEKKKIRERMAALGKKGGKKSGESRRGKKKVGHDADSELPAQSDLGLDGNGQDLATETPGGGAS